MISGITKMSVLSIQHSINLHELFIYLFMVTTSQHKHPWFGCREYWHNKWFECMMFELNLTLDFKQQTYT